MRNHFLIFVFFISLSIKAQLYFPPLTGSTWSTTTPQSLGWCTDKIDSLYSFLELNKSKAFIVLKDGKIVLEKYFGTFTQDSIWYWASAGKTLTGFAMGIAQREGKLNINDTSSKYLGKAWSSLTPAQEAKIKVLNHLTMTTGLDDGVAEDDCTLPTCLVYKADPGTRWAYHNAPYTLCDKIIETATGSNLNTYIANKIKTQTGIAGLFVKNGYNNVFYSTPRSFARFGLLLLNKGTWNGNNLLNDSNYFKSMTNTSQQINKSYGYLTWLNGKSSYMIPKSQIVIPEALCPDAPADMYAAMGKNGQYINVVPSKNLVVIRMGNAYTTSLVPNTFNNDIWKKLNAVICTTGSNKNIKQTQINISPIPANSAINMELPAGSKSFVILNSMGKIIQYSTVISNQISVKNFAAGVYFLITKNSQNQVLAAGKFVVAD